MTEPRWKSGGAPVEGLSEALAALSTRHASDVELARLKVALAAQLAAPTRSMSGAASGGLLPWLGSTRVWPWLSVVAVGLAATWMLARPREESAPPAVPSEVRARVVASSVPDAVNTPPALEASAPALQQRPPDASRRVSKRRSPTALPEGPSAALHPEAELLLLQKAQSALNRSASTALELAEEHARLYPNGVFQQEREMLRIEAELTLGRRRAALDRAHDFSERFGRSTYRARIDRLLASHRALKKQEDVASERTE